MTAIDVAALVNVEGLTKTYRSGAGEQVVLDDLSLRVDQGELVVILGPSGCGKTTLLNVLGGLDRADRGSVRSCGVDLTHASPGELTAYRARSVGFIFQFYNLLPTLTALENVEAGVTVAGIDRPAARRSCAWTPITASAASSALWHAVAGVSRCAARRRARRLWSTSIGKSLHADHNPQRVWAASVRRSRIYRRAGASAVKSSTSATDDKGAWRRGRPRVGLADAAPATRVRT